MQINAATETKSPVDPILGAAPVVDRSDVAQPTDAQTRAEEIEALRRERIPFNGKERKLALNVAVPGYYTHWFNDENGRVQRAYQAGYRHVTNNETVLNNAVTPINNDLGSNVRCAVGGQANGEPLYAYLMKLPLELFEEDQAAQQAELDKIDTAIQTGVPEVAFNNPDKPGAAAFAYAPKDKEGKLRTRRTASDFIIPGSKDD